jgi:hypothetical protein
MTKPLRYWAAFRRLKSGDLDMAAGGVRIDEATSRTYRSRHIEGELDKALTAERAGS